MKKKRWLNFYLQNRRRIFFMFLKNTVFRLWCNFCQFFLTVLTVLKKPELINAKSFLGWWLMMLYQKIEKRKSFNFLNFSISLPHYMWFIKKCPHLRQTRVFSFNFVRSKFCGVPPPKKKEKLVKFTLEEHSLHQFCQNFVPKKVTKLF